MRSGQYLPSEKYSTIFGISSKEKFKDKE